MYIAGLDPEILGSRLRNGAFPQRLKPFRGALGARLNARHGH